MLNPTLLRSDLGMKRIARITGGGGLFDLLSRAWEVNKESLVIKKFKKQQQVKYLKKDIGFCPDKTAVKQSMERF